MQGAEVAGRLLTLKGQSTSNIVTQKTQIYLHTTYLHSINTNLYADVDGVGEALGRALPDDGEDLLEVGLVQLLLRGQFTYDVHEYLPKNSRNLH